MYLNESRLVWPLIALWGTLIVACGDPLTGAGALGNGSGVVDAGPAVGDDRCAHFLSQADAATPDDREIYLYFHENCQRCTSLEDQRAGESDPDRRDQLGREIQDCWRCDEPLQRALEEQEAQKRQQPLDDYLECSGDESSSGATALSTAARR